MLLRAFTTVSSSPAFADSSAASLLRPSRRQALGPLKVIGRLVCDLGGFD
jgi:hypothetical protein